MDIEFIYTNSIIFKNIFCNLVIFIIVLSFNFIALFVVRKSYFCRLFKAVTDKTPMEYLNSYRIEKAAAKLLSTDESVTDIAYSCGFNDLSYFIKVFRDFKGISPKQFRKPSK